jgi:hypothetical protein
MFFIILKVFVCCLFLLSATINISEIHRKNSLDDKNENTKINTSMQIPHFAAKF